MKDFHHPTLDEIVGQDEAVRYLKSLAKTPRQEALLFLGKPGIGKTVAAHAFANEVAGDDEFKGHWTVPCSTLGITEAKTLFYETLSIRWDSKTGFNVLILEEMEYLSPQCQGFLKTALDKAGKIFRQNLIVIATSNDVSNIKEAIIERFKTFEFDSSKAFYVSCREVIPQMWAEATDKPLPGNYRSWGIDAKRRFSMRQAISEMEKRLELSDG